MNKYLVCLIWLLLSSCTVSKKLTTNYQSKEDLINFYSNRSVTNFLYVKDLKNYTNLSETDRNSIPQNFIFDENGIQVSHIDSKICKNPTLLFLNNFDEKVNYQKTNYRIVDYLSHFKTSNSNISIEAILKSKKIRVFLNTATYAEHVRSGKVNANSEPYEIYKNYKDNQKFEIYFVNMDLLKDWNSTINPKN